MTEVVDSIRRVTDIMGEISSSPLRNPKNPAPMRVGEVFEA
jgi:hypothetical protein